MYIKCVAIDKDCRSLDVISGYCKKRGNIECVVSTDTYGSVALIKRICPSLVFIDIESVIDDLSSFYNLPEGIVLVITTSSVELAIKGYDLGAIYCLLKPFSYSQFMVSIVKAIKRLSFVSNLLPKGHPQIYMVLRHKYKNVNIPFQQIVYISSKGNYVCLHLTNMSFIETRLTLKKIIGYLPSGEFIQIHRTIVVSLQYICSYTMKSLLLMDGTVVPVGKVYSSALFCMDNNK